MNIPRHVWFSFIVAAIVAVPSVAGQQATQAPPTFRARADHVSVDVAVHRRGRPVTGLMAEDFELLDNGVPQRISSLSFETLPIDVTVALDVSASVAGAVLDQMRQSVRQLGSALAPNDRLRLLTFNVRVNRSIDFGEPISRLDATFDDIQPIGGTAMRDALAVALTTPSPPDRRQFIVAFSDGEDRSSVTSEEELLDVARRTRPTLGLVLASYVLRTGSAEMWSSPDARSRGAFYAQVARETGGFVETVDARESLGSRFRDALTDFRKSYVLYFTPTGVERSGAHSLDVRVKRDGVDVRTRRQYVSQ